MAKQITAIDNELIESLLAIREEIAALEAEYADAKTKCQKYIDVAETAETALNEKKAELFKGVEQLPDNLQKLYLPVTPPPKVVSSTNGAGKGKEETIASIKAILADGPMTEADLRKAFGAGKRLRVNAYITEKLIAKDEKGMISLV
jgi:hypothetical protein